MIALASERHLYTIVSTNAQALTRDMAQALVGSGLNKIIVSMDGLTQASYEQYRVGGHLDKVLIGLQYLRDAKQESRSRAPQIELQCLMLASNEHEWPTLRHQYKALGADTLALKTAQFYDYEHGNPLMPSPAYARYIQGTDGLYRLRSTFSMSIHRWIGIRPCWRVLTGCVIGTNGDVLPCCFDKAHEHKLGNIFTEDWSVIAPRRRAFIRTIWTKKQFPMCGNCTD